VCVCVWFARARARVCEYGSGWGEEKRASPLLRRACEPTSLVAACIVSFSFFFFSFSFSSFLMLVVIDKNKCNLQHY